jgi:deoxyribodipyrimidine photolyase-related protein
LVSTAPRVLFADQLGPHFDDGGPLIIPEVRTTFQKHSYHRQKAHLILSALRHRIAELGDRVEHISAASYHEALAGKELSMINPTSRNLRLLVADLSQNSDIDVQPARGFLTSEDDFGTWVTTQGTKRLLMENFYRDGRRATGILMEEAPSGGLEPAGGAYNFDKENRNPPPKGVDTLGVPHAWSAVEDEIDREVRHYLDEWEASGDVAFIGSDGPRIFPATRAEALEALEVFVTQRLKTFGPTEDAAMSADWAMSHSLLSPAMNLGLLHPREVIDRAVEEFTAGRVDIASVEGFVRQVMGWREWVWHLYWHLGEDFEQRNHFDHHTPLPAAFATLDPSEISSHCLSQVLGEVRERGWTHHINRLMVLGSWALQRQIDPQALNQWFVNAFVDGTPWVMPANVIGMSQYADGGIVATKPYTSGGAYINTMTNYCKSCVFRPTIRVGEQACPLSAGYWAFLDREQESLRRNHRMFKPLAGLARLADREEVVAQEAVREKY